MKTLRSLFIGTLMAFAYLVPAALAAEQPVPAPQQQPASLYQRLGGYDALAAVTDDFLGRLATDPSLGWSSRVARWLPRGATPLGSSKASAAGSS